MTDSLPTNVITAGDISAPQAEPRFSFFKGGVDVIAPKDQEQFDWEQAAAKVREQLGDALNARNVSFLLGSGCSSFLSNGQQLGIPTMAPMATAFLAQTGIDEGENKSPYITQVERDQLQNGLGIDLTKQEYKRNLAVCGKRDDIF